MGYGARKIYNKFRQPNWTYSGVQKTVEKIKKTGTIDRIEGSGRPRSSNPRSPRSSKVSSKVSQEVQR